MRTASISALFLVAACGGGSEPGATDAPDHSADAPGDGSPDAPACGAAGPAQMVCGGACIDTSSDPEHCGDCATTCSGATSSCAGGMCRMPLTTIWEHHFGGDAFGYNVAAVAVDGAGNVYLTGAVPGTADLGGGPLVSAGSDDILIASYSPTGTHRWSRLIGGTGNDQGAGITTDGTQVYVTGQYSAVVDFGGGAQTAAGSADAFVLTLSSATGAYVAARVFGTPGDDAGLGVVVDAQGNVTVGGFFGAGTLDFGGGNTITGAGFNAFVASATAAGVHRWSRRLSGTTSTTISSCQAIGIDAAGNVTTGGDLQETTDFGGGTVTALSTDVFVASYSSTGTYRWSRTFGGSQSDDGNALAVAPGGDVVVGGIFHGTVPFGGTSLTSTGVVDGFVALLDGATGTPRFARNLGASSSGGVDGLAFDPAGNVIAGGSIEGTADLGTGPLAPLGVYDIFLAGFDKTTGAGLFAKRYGGTDYDEANTVAVTPGGAIAAGGQFRQTVDLGLGAITGGTMDNGYVIMFAP